MLINKDPSNAHEVKIEFDDGSGSPARRFAGTITTLTFGAEQYVWHPQGAKSHADPYGPPATTSMDLRCRRLSVTVLREKLDRN